jgi:hypothetical protein
MSYHVCSLQLFDRNAQQEFAPTAAFQGNMPENFLAELQTAAVGKEGLLQSGNTRVALVLR